MESPDIIERIWDLIRQARRDGVIGHTNLRIEAGPNLVTALLTHPQMRHTSMASLSQDTKRKFGIPVNQSNSWHGLRLTYQLDG